MHLDTVSTALRADAGSSGCRWRIVALLTLVLFGAAGAGRAEPRVAVLDATGEHDPAWRQADREVVVLLRNALAATGLELLAPEALAAYFAEPADPRADEMVARAREQLVAGRRHSTQLEPRAAIEAFQGALRNLRAVFPFLQDLSALAETHLQLGMTYQALGQEAEATREYRMVLLLEPERKLDDAVFNPVVIERFEQVRQELLSSMKGSVSLISQPAGGRVAMDGRPVGRTPITIPGVLPGEHYFSIRHPGYRTWFGVLSVPAGGVERQEVFLVEGQRIERWRRLQKLAGPAPSARAADGLAKGLGVDWLVVLTQRHPGGQHLIQLTTHQRGGQPETLGIFPVAADGLDELADRLQRHLRGDATAFGAAAGPDPIDGQPPPPVAAGPAWYERWWFWTAVGAVVAGAAATTTVLLLDRDSGIRVDVYR